MKKSIVIIGSGGHAKVMIDVIERQGVYEIAGLIDQYEPQGTYVYGYEVLGDEIYLLDHMDVIYGGIIAVGDNWTRAKLASLIRRNCPQFRFISAVHPSSCVARGVQLGEGTVVMAGAIVNSDTVIGKHSILNTKCSVDHDCIIGDFVTIAPNATVCGDVTIGDYSIICLGAGIIHTKHIGSHTVIGAGSTVLNDIGSNQVAYGTPAKVIRERKKDEVYL